MTVANESISYEETSSLIKRCAQEKTNKEIAQTIGVAESRISEGKKGKWRLRQAQKDKLINEFGFEQLHKGRYLVVQRTKCFETMLTAIKTYDLIIKTEEYFTSEPFKAFLTNINIDALLEHSTSKDWFAHISQHQDNILSHPEEHLTLMPYLKY
jgi:predicted transcriptional regulator